MAELTQYENPLTGKTENLFDISSIFGKVLGVVVMLFVIATGQNVAKTISGKTKIDTQLDPFISVPAPAPTNTKRVY